MGIRNKIRNAIRNKVSSVANSTKTTLKKAFLVESIKEQHNYIKEMGKVAFVPENKRRHVYNEMFEQAMERHGVTDDDLRKTRSRFIQTFYVSAFFILVSLFFSSKFIMEQNIIAVLQCLAVMLISLSLCFTYSFRAYQIKIRKLCSVKEYFESGDYFPSSNK